MPFRAQCVFCGQQVRAPDYALGASARCPKCSNFFTLAPEGEVKAPGPPSGRWLLHRVLPKPPPILWVPCTLPAPDLGRAFEAGPSAGLLAKAALVMPDEGLRPKPRWIEPFGLGALLSGGAALWCASAPSLCGIVVPLSLVSLLLGLLGLLLVLAKRRSRLRFPVAGTALGCVVLFTSLRVPNLLGPVYLASRGRDVVGPGAIRVVPLPGSFRNAGPGDPEWVDASRAALQQGRMHVQVISASVRLVKAKSSPTKTIPPRQYLFIRLRTHQVEVASEFATKRSQTPGPRFEKPRPRLTDSTGNVYQPRDVLEMAAVENERKTSVFPVVFQDEVFVFEAPPPSLEDLRLEVPAEAWGGKGAFRFTIPGSMIQYKRAGPAGSAGLAGGR